MNENVNQNDTEIVDKKCIGCSLSATSLQCPNCLKLGKSDSYFCSQQCFRNNWSEHKLVHKTIGNKKIETTYNPWPDFEFSGTLKPCYPLSAKRSVPEHILRPDYADHPLGESECEQSIKGSTHIKVLNDEEIESMRIAGRLAREVLDVAYSAIGVGVTTDEVDRLVHEACIERECYPSPLNYYNFPKSCCTSVNEVICHGIPDLRPLQDGDICNVDITVFHRGFHGDLNETFFVGNVSEESKKLVRITWESLQKAIQIIKPGEKYREIGNVIQKHVQSHGFSVVRSYCGHGMS
jgi:methionyl aminopeptidase